MSALRIFSPGAQRQDLEYARWKGIEEDITGRAYMPTPTQELTASLATEHQSVVQSTGHALVSHTVMIERLLRSA